MTSINSAEALRTNNATSLKSSIDKTQQAGAMGASFAQQLATASSNLSASGVSSAANNIINAAQSGLNLTNGSGLTSNELVSQSLKSGVQTQFTHLGNDIASSLIASFSGQNNPISTDSQPATTTDTATETDPTSSVNAAQKTTDSETQADTNNNVEGATDSNPITAASKNETADAAQIAAAKEAESSSSFFPEFIQNLFADLSIFKTQTSTELSDLDTQESDTDPVNEENQETNATTNTTTEEKVTS